jgi:hypothetical protein
MPDLKIQEGEGSTTFRIEGRLAGPVVTELERCWQIAEHVGPHAVRVDLCKVAEIDDAGKNLLKRMFSKGVEFVVAPHAMTHFVTESNDLLPHMRSPARN